MSDILTNIVEKRLKDIEIKGASYGITLPQKRKRPLHLFLNDKGLILEIKRASPSKGDIAPELDAKETALSYAKAGAKAISCLTEENYFKGSLIDLMDVCDEIDKYEKSNKVTGPAILRKDFLLSREDIDISYLAGADAVLLIARILDSDTLIQMAECAASYNMTSLIEVRSSEDLEKLKLIVNAFSEKKLNKDFIVCGVNSRDLATFKIDLLKPCSILSDIKCILGQDARVVFESGIRSPDSAAFAGSLGFSALLLGEAAAKNTKICSNFVKAFSESQKNSNAEFWKKYSSIMKNNKKKALIKICGLTNTDDMFYADSLGADFIGFIFAPGFARSIYGEKFNELIKYLHMINAIKVAVITDIKSKEAKAAFSYVKKGLLDCIQFHGLDYDEIPKKLLQIPHYFAITDNCSDKTLTSDKLFLQGEARYLQDSKEHDYIEKHKLWLAGGIGLENIEEIISKYKPELIDISSSIESEICKKDLQKMEKIFYLLEN